jgi:hypothetical protein
LLPPENSPINSVQKNSRNTTVIENHYLSLRAFTIVSFKYSKGMGDMATKMRDLNEFEVEVVTGGTVRSNTDVSINTPGTTTAVLNKFRFLGPPETNGAGTL